MERTTTKVRIHELAREPGVPTSKSSRDAGANGDTDVDPRARFERQLAEARQRTEARRREEDDARKDASEGASEGASKVASSDHEASQAPVNAPAAARPAGRPAVGDVIAIPGRRGARPAQQSGATGSQARAEHARPDGARPGRSAGPQSRPAGGAESRSPGRQDARPQASRDSGPDARSPARPDGRPHARPPDRQGRPDNRSDSSDPRSQARPTGRPDGRQHGRPDSRSNNRIDGRGNQRSSQRTDTRQQAPSERPAPAEHKRVLKLEDSISVAALARAMSMKPAALLGKIWAQGMTGLTINSSIDFDTAALVADALGFTAQNVAFNEEEVLDTAPRGTGERTPRSPVVTIMGHVDHGKTTLLDTIRKTRVAAGEAGGITQHIGAYRAGAPEIGTVVFLDTPGHEAFTAMRARGASITDIVVLLAAADDGVMPQTLEALSHARDAAVPIIVAVSKCDVPGAKPDRVRTQLAEHGLVPEEWGGSTQYVNIAAKRGEGINELLEAIAVQAHVLELAADASRPATGAVLEARLDRGRGPVATVLVQEGTLRVGDIVVVGELFGRVRTMTDDSGQALTEAGPSMPVEIAGLPGVPEAGDAFHVTDEATARQVVEHRCRRKRERELASRARTLDSMAEELRAGERDEVKELGVVLKADVHGSAEALRHALTRLSTEKVRVNVVHAGVGGITESDVRLARVGGAVILGFNVRPAGKAGDLARREGVPVRVHSIIYDLLEEVRGVMVGLLPPVRKERGLGRLEVRETFRVAKAGTVAGCMVTEGLARRNALVRVIRDAVQTYEGRIKGLKRFKDDVTEVQHGHECGVLVDGFQDIRPGDVLEVYEITEETPSLGDAVAVS